MHKVITVNLNGNAYQVEEGGYAALCDYLDAAEAQLKDNPDCAEIVSDLEQAIAEKCQNFLGPQKTVVTSAEIDRIIEEMGPVDGGPGGAEDAEAAAPPKDAPGSGAGADPRAPRRLFRIYEGRRLSGVCKGLAAYFGIDVNIVRVVFLILAFLTHGVMIPIYIIWIVVVPYAQTSEDYAAAYGMPFNAQDFINDAKQHYGDLKNEGKDWQRRAKQHTREWQRAWRRGFRNARRPWDDLPGPRQLLLGLIASLLGVLTLLYLIRTMPFSPFGFPMQIPVWIGIAILIFALKLVLTPFRFALGYPHDAYRGSHVGHLLLSWISVAWIIGMILAGIYTYNHVPEVRYFFQNPSGMWHDMWNR